MPSKKVNDMVPKRSIRDISKKDILPSKRTATKFTPKISKAKGIKEIQKTPDQINPSRSADIIGVPKVVQKPKPYGVETRYVESSNSGRQSSTKSRKTLYTILSIAAVLVVLLSGAAMYFTYNATATVQIKPKVVSVPVDMIFTAKKTPTASVEIPYEIINLTQTASATVDGVEGGFIQNKSKGVVTLYNNYQNSGQSLALGTRIEGSGGLVYRLSKAVVIPGRKTVAGKVTPGSVDVVVIADQPGDIYNSKIMDLKGDFKIIGFKGTAKYNEIFGRQKTDFTGGYVGREWKIAPAIASTTISNLRNSLAAELDAQYMKSIPADYVTFPGNATTTYGAVEYVPRGNGKVDIQITGNLSGVMISQKSIAGVILNRQQSKYTLDVFTPKNIQDLDYMPITKNFSAKSAQNLVFKLTGNMQLEGSVPLKDLTDKLVGMSTSQNKAVFSNYPGIASAEVIISPFWVHSFPSNPSKITTSIVK